MRKSLLLAAALLFLAPAAFGGAAKVDVCHVPPGNPDNYHPIRVADSAVLAHVENHGDWLVTDEICDGLDNDCDGAIDEGIEGCSCVGRCGGPYDPSLPCQCNNQCLRFEDCCPDAFEVCDGSCEGTPCDGAADVCWCNDACYIYGPNGDCCPDKEEYCPSP